MPKYLVYIETVGDMINQRGPLAHVPALPGAAARGKTVEEAKENIHAAIIEYLQLLRNVGEPASPSTTARSGPRARSSAACWSTSVSTLLSSNIGLKHIDRSLTRSNKQILKNRIRLVW